MYGVPDGWDSPTLRKNYDDDSVEVITPLRCYGGDIARILAESNVDGEQCPAIANGHVCPLTVGHIGDHWYASLELAAEAAPIRVWTELVG